MAQYDIVGIVDPKEITNIKNLRTEISGTAEDLRKFLKVQDDLKKQMDETSKASNGATEKAGEYAAILNKAAESHNKLTASAKELDSQQRQLSATEAKLANANTQTSKTLADKKRALQEANEVTKLNSIINDKNSGTLQKARAENKLLQLQKEKLISTDSDYVSKLEEINNKQDENNQLLKDSGNVAQQQSANIGNYSSAFGGLFDQFKSGEIGAKGLIKGVLQLGKAFIVAIVTNPILLVVGAIVGAFTSLVAAFKQTQEGQDVFAEKMMQLKAVVDVIVGRIAMLAKAVVLLFKGEFKEAGKVATEAFSNIGEEIKATVESASKIFELEKSLRQLNITAVKSIAELNKLEALQTAIADDATRSFKEREDAAKIASKAIIDRAGVQLKLAKDEYSITQQINKQKEEQGLLTDELRQKEAELYAKVIDSESEYQITLFDNEKQRRELKQDRLEKDLDILIDGFDYQKTINEKIIANEKYTITERQKLLDETVKLGEESFNKQIGTIQQFTDLKIDANDLLATSDATVLNEKIRGLGLSEVIEGRLLEVIKEKRIASQDFADAQQGLDESEATRKEEQAKKELDDFKNMLDKKTAEAELQYNQELLLLKASSKNNEDFEKKKGELDKSYLEKNLDSLSILLENTKISADQRLEIEQEIANQKLNLQQIVFDDEQEKNEKRKESMQVVADSITQIQGALFDFMDAKYSGDLERLEQKNAAGLLSEKEYATQKAEIEIKQAKASRMRAIFEATIGTAQAVISALQTKPFMPFGLIMAATAGIVGGLQIASILSTPLPVVPAFATGTLSAPSAFVAGEKGRELMQLKSGEKMMVDKATYFSGEKYKGARIMTNKQTEWIMNRTDHSGFEHVGNSDQLLNEIKGMRSDMKNVKVPIMANGRMIGYKQNQTTVKIINRYNGIN